MPVATARPCPRTCHFEPTRASEVLVQAYWLRSTTPVAMKIPSRMKGKRRPMMPIIASGSFSGDKPPLPSYLLFQASSGSESRVMIYR